MSVGLIADLSRYRPIVDMELAVKNGLVAFITKATEDTLTVDPTFAADMALAKKYNVLAGAFHFGRSFDPIAEAKHFLGIVKPYDTQKLLCALDFEATMSVAQAEQWVDYVFAQRGIRPVIYTRKTYVEARIGLRDTALSLCPLWVASYQNSPSWPRQWETYAIHQYSNGSDGPLPHGIGGIRDDIDMDRFNPMFGELAQWWGTDLAVPSFRAEIADQVASPIGPDQLTDGLWRTYQDRNLGGWYDATPYAMEYASPGGLQAYHTGADLNLPLDADAEKPVLAVANAVVVFADRIIGSSWGNIIILEALLPAKKKVWFRYAHLDAMIVRPGDVVAIGQQIASVGNGYGLVPYHLHFDVSESGVLGWGFDGARDWPGMNLTYLKANYSDPRAWLQAHMQGPVIVIPPTPEPTPDGEKMHVTTALRLRSDHSTKASILETMAVGTEVVATDTFDDGKLVWRKIVAADGRSGWSAQTDHLTPWLADDVIPTPNPGPLPPFPVPIPPQPPTPPTPTPPPPPVWMKMFVTGSANLRQGPSYASADIGDLTLGETVQVLQGSDTFDPTTKITYVKLQSPDGWMSKKLLSSTYSPPVIIIPQTPDKPSNLPAARRQSKVGLHLMPQAPYQPTADFLNAARNAGKPVPYCTVVRFGWGGEFTASGIKSLSPSTKVCQRWYRQDWDHKGEDFTKQDLTADGSAWVHAYYNDFMTNDTDWKSADWVQVINEPPEGAGTPSWWMSAMKAAESLNFHLAIGCFAIGYPPLDSEPGPDFWKSMWDVLRYAKANGHVLMLHEYILPDPGGDWESDWTIQRHDRIYAEFPADLKDMPLVIGECGTGFAAGMDTNSFIAGLVHLDRGYADDLYLIGLGLWTDGGGGAWGQSRVEGKLPAIKTYVVGY